MRNPAPINHFPPTLFSPNGSPIYGEAHFFAAMSAAVGSAMRVWSRTVSMWAYGSGGAAFGKGAQLELQSATKPAAWHGLNTPVAERAKRRQFSLWRWIAG